MNCYQDLTFGRGRDIIVAELDEIPAKDGPVVDGAARVSF